MNLLPVLKTMCKNVTPVAIPNHINIYYYLCRNYGIFTHQLQKELNSKHYTISLNKIRYHLKKLKDEGKVISIPNKGGSTRWWVK